MVNEKLSHCLEVMEMISSHLDHEHGAFLEKTIIVLIAIEIRFELIHFYERKCATVEEEVRNIMLSYQLKCQIQLLLCSVHFFAGFVIVIGVIACTVLDLIVSQDI